MKKEPEFHDTKETAGPMYGHKPWRVYGRQLEAGDVLQADDVYDSTSGGWEPCPCPGLTLEPGTMTKWVRPA